MPGCGWALIRDPTVLPKIEAQITYQYMEHHNQDKPAKDVTNSQITQPAAQTPPQTRRSTAPQTPPNAGNRAYTHTTGHATPSRTLAPAIPERPLIYPADFELSAETVYVGRVPTKRLRAPPRKRLKYTETRKNKAPGC